MDHNTQSESTGRTAGKAVKKMIEAMEEKMAAGEHISAAPSSKAEAEHLQKVKRENANSSERTNG